jgi:hypothetical protein
MKRDKNKAYNHVMAFLKLFIVGALFLSTTSLRSDETSSIDRLRLTAVDDSPPVITNQIPAAGALVRELNHLEIYFNKTVVGLEADDLLINGAPATNVAAVAPGQYLFKFTPPNPGSVQVSWKAGHGIQDETARPFVATGWSYVLDPVIAKPRILITEFMAENDKTLNDEDGDASDWIEIYNAEEIAINLNGWFLTDATNNLAKWRFPDVSLLPNTYLVVFASEKNRTNPVARLHTNFKLDKGGEYLALVDRAANIASEFAPNYPAQYTDVSYGRDFGNPNIVGYFAKATPGAANVPGGSGFSSDIQFSRPSGTFFDPFQLALSAASSNAVIRYTIGTNLPTEASAIYTAPITITNTAHVRARAFEAGLLPGAPRSESYVALDTNLVTFSSTLPIVILHDNGAGAVSASLDKFVIVQIFEPKNGRSSLTNPPSLTTRAKFKLRGSSTESYPKGSYALETWDEFNGDRDVPILGMPADSDWVFYAPNNFEPVLIHNPFIYQLSNEIGRYAPRTRFAEVYVNTRGGVVLTNNYNGIYVIEERIKRSAQRVDIDRLEPEHVNPPEVTGGYVFKVDRADPGDGGFSGGGQNVLWVYPKEREIETPQRDPQEQYVRKYFTSFGTALNSASFTNAETGYRQYVDVESWIDHHLLNVLAFNVDALRLSTYFYKPRNGKLFFGPIWDFDRALGSTDGRDANPKVWAASGGTDFFTYPWWNRMFRDPDFWQQWIDRWQELRRAQFSTNSLMTLFDSMTSQIKEAQPRERARWRVSLRGGSYESEINFSKSWLLRRVEFMDTNFVSPAKLSSPGGRIRPGFPLAITGPTGGTIFYTINGSDPRGAGGTLSAGALEYKGPITLAQNARVVARVRNLSHRNLTGGLNPPLSSQWSGPIAATFITQPSALIISELMYHPPPPQSGNTNDADNFEFIELKNSGSTTLNLTGVRFIKGVEFAFSGSAVTTLAPGQRVIIVKNRAAFVARYGSLPNIAGEFVGNLDNNGESLALEGALKETIFDFSYRDDWYPVTDGLGFSLVLSDETSPASSLADKTSWRASKAPLGSPGQPDPPPLTFPGVVINEVLANSDPNALDFVELHNPTTQSVILGGWFLTDDFQDPKKFRIPAGTTIAGGGYLVFDLKTLSADKTRGFALRASGDEIYLLSADAETNLTGYLHGFAFGASEEGTSLGRHLISTGAERFVPQIKRTVGTTNAGPKVGPVIINEIMYNPSPILGANNVIDEYIELRNVTGGAIPLFESGKPTNTWRIEGGVIFSFAPNSMLPPNSNLLLVSFDPVNDPASLTAFRTHFGLASTASIVGPYTGKLDNVGERIELLRPVSSQDSGAATAWISIDPVRYSSDFPWPTDADGTGRSLQRLSSSLYGDDPANWQAALPTPAADNPDRSATDADSDGLPNDWESTHGLDPRSANADNGPGGDPDRDGLTNLQEFQSGTDPRSAASYLKVESITSSSGAIKIRFLAIAGKTYSIQYREEIGADRWQKLLDVPAQLSTTEMEVIDATANPGFDRFYRIATPRAP